MPVRTKARPPLIWRSPVFCAAVAGQRRQAGEENGGLGRAGAQFGQADDQRGGGDGTDAGNGEEDVEAALERGIGADAAFDLGVQAFDVAGEDLQPPVEFGSEKDGLAGAAPIGQSRLLGDRRRPRPRQLLHRFQRLGRRREGFRFEGLAHQRQQARVEPIGLGELADGLGEQTGAQWIDDGDGEAGRVQAAMRLAVELAGRLHDDQLDRQVGEATLEGSQADGRVRRAEVLAKRVEVDVQPIFTNIDADVDSGLRASFGRILTLHAGLAPNHLFRTSAKDGRTKLIRGSKPRGLRSRPPDARGMAIPRASARNLRDSRQSEHARGAGDWPRSQRRGQSPGPSSSPSPACAFAYSHISPGRARWMPEPCSASMALRARYAGGLQPPVDPCARLRPFAIKVFDGQIRPDRAGIVRRRPWRTIATSMRRCHREAAEAERRTGEAG